MVREDEVCRRLTTIPGVGPVVAPHLYGNHRHSWSVYTFQSAVGSVLGLTPKLNESGESKRVGRVSCCGDAMMRSLLYEAAQVLLVNVKKWSWLKCVRDEHRQTPRQAKGGLSRWASIRLSVIMHRMWSDGTEFRWTRESLPRCCVASNQGRREPKESKKNPPPVERCPLAGRWMR